ncbi:oxidoreductase-like protein family [Elsinoe ampelina]|uniref:Oxidoreductase-like protein family n=1 Tax=Elsinoe ampelina TaxID=302913 RepID=A0A6A6GK08_9PEZI|nr:oxidoreductase-like protein family [Elsinoe ampelina]
MSIGVAILGSGIFVREEHLPAVLATPALSLKAIFSRSAASANKLVSEASLSDIEIYSSDSNEAKSLSALLARDDVKAVMIALPIITQPEITKQCLDAGKHILSEKPVGPSLSTARDLISHYKSLSNPPQWAVAEQFRILRRFVYAGEQVQKLGKVLSFRLRLSAFVKPGAKYYETEWRKKPENQGGFLLDGGVHFIAGIRIALGKQAAITEVTGFSNQAQEHLPPVDTIVGAARLQSGGIGTIDLSFGSTDEGAAWVVCCEKGRVEVEWESVLVVEDGNKRTEQFPKSSGVTEEVQVWAKGIEEGKPDPRQTPQEALGDLEVVSRDARLYRHC